MDYTEIIKPAITVICTLVLAYFGYIKKRIGAVDKLVTAVHGDDSSGTPGLLKLVDKLTNSVNGDASADGILKDVRELIEDTEEINNRALQAGINAARKFDIDSLPRSIIPDEEEEI